MKNNGEVIIWINYLGGGARVILHYAVYLVWQLNPMMLADLHVPLIGKDAFPFVQYNNVLTIYVNQLESICHTVYINH